jgi:hypothetical protein
MRDRAELVGFTATGPHSIQLCSTDTVLLLHFCWSQTSSGVGQKGTSRTSYCCFCCPAKYLETKPSFQVSYMSLVSLWQPADFIASYISLVSSLVFHSFVSFLCFLNILTYLPLTFHLTDRSTSLSPMHPRLLICLPSPLTEPSTRPMFSHTYPSHSCAFPLIYPPHLLICLPDCSLNYTHHLLL